MNSAPIYGILGLAAGAGAAHTCALSAMGSAYCWGNNSYGQLGNGEFVPAYTPSLVIDVLPASGAIAVPIYLKLW